MPAVPDHTRFAFAVPVQGAVQARYTRPTTITGPPPIQDLSVIGATGAPGHLPDQLVQVQLNQVGYQDLFSTLDPTGVPSRGMYPGTYAITTGALLKG